MGNSITVSRDTLRPGHPDRDWLYVWGAGFDLFTHQFPVGELVQGETRVPLKYFRPKPWVWTEPFHAGFRLLAQTLPGIYTLVVDGIEAGPIEVKRPYLPGTLVKSLNLAALESYDVELPAGTYKVTRPIKMPAGRRLFGYNTRLIVDPQPKFYNGVESLVFGPIGDNCEIRGIEFTFPNTLCPSAVNGLLLAECTFRSNNWRLNGQGGVNGGNVTLIGRNNAVMNCGFLDGGNGGGDGMWIGNKFYGLPDGNSHAFLCNGNENPLMLMDTLFDGTDRGPVIRPTNKNVDASFVSHLNCLNINQMYNGGELICGDGGPYKFKGCIWNNVNFNNCASDLQIDANMEDCRLHRFIGDDLQVFFRDGYTQERNILYNSELRNGKVYLGDGARGNRLFWNGFLGWQARAGNQLYCHPDWYAQRERYKAAIVVRNPDAHDMNEMENANTFRLPPDVAHILPGGD